jgi:integrase
MLKHGVPLKVVSERLGHSTPAFTMAVYQHVLPGMQRDAANIFARGRPLVTVVFSSCSRRR